MASGTEIGPLVPLDQNNNSSNIKKMGKNYEKYSLRPRSIQKRIETEKRAKEPKKIPKPKLKPPPLSKYRRKTANARERSRMQEINFAFDALQRLVPQYPILPVNAQGKTCEKLTKITTLRLAMDYISKMSKQLGKGESQNGVSEGAVVMEDDRFSNMSPGSSSAASSSEFSPASSSSSSYTLSPSPVFPIQPSVPTSTPNFLQTVMRSVVLPPPTSSRRSNVNQGSFPSSALMTSSFLSTSKSSPSYLPSFSTSLPLSSSSSSGPYVLKLPTTAKFNHPINQSMSSLIIKCSGDGNRTGSLSSLTESDLSEYTSDLLSDEGSSLDDPMFDDIIGVDSGVCGTVDDLDHLILESDGESLHFGSNLNESYTHPVH